jgi:RNA polymerase sigma-70 factor (ECF subfamily)
MQSGADESGFPKAFGATHWTVVLEAARPNSPAGQTAFAQLYSDYWHPLYAFVRRRGLSAEEAEDITQSFFVRLIEKEALSNLRREGGRFRSFLLGALCNFLTNEWDRQHAQKRGGGQKPLSLDVSDEEGRYAALEAPDQETPESLFEKQWVSTLLSHVAERLGREQASGHKAALFEDLKPHLQSDASGRPYAEIALKHGTSEGAIKVAVHRLRQQYGLLLREEIARTVSAREEVEDELRHLLRVISD